MASDHVLDFMFWANQSWWPKATGEKIFLADAVHVVGKRLFGGEWTGSEPWCRRHVAEPGTQLYRLQRVANWLVRESYRLGPTGLRKRGGPWIKLPTHVWNLGNRDPLRERFFRCRIDHPGSDGEGKLIDDYTWLFFDREALIGALEELPNRQGPAALHPTAPGPAKQPELPTHDLVANAGGAVHDDDDTHRFSNKEESERWYQERVAEVTQRGQRYNREEDEAAGRAVGLNRPRVRELRDKHAPEDWHKRRKKAGQ